MPIHFSDLASLYPQTPKAILQATVDPLNAAMHRCDISTGSRMAAFVSEVGHESMNFTRMSENLNYSAEGLHKTFPRYFPTQDLCNHYARQPQRIANRVYASRMGNGPEASGDGYRYRGRGFIQITGRENYIGFAKFMEMTLEDAVGFMETREGAAMSAAWFWTAHGLNTLADQGRYRDLTIRINGGLNGWDDRLAHYERAKRLLG
jgi:putative chitinase